MQIGRQEDGRKIQGYRCQRETDTERDTSVGRFQSTIQKTWKWKTTVMKVMKAKETSKGSRRRRREWRAGAG